MGDEEVRAALDHHWAASDANDFDAEHQIYREDAVLEYQQSGERIRGRGNIQSSRQVQPNHKRFTVRQITGAGDLWVTEFVLTPLIHPAGDALADDLKPEAAAVPVHAGGLQLGDPEGG